MLLIVKPLYAMQHKLTSTINYLLQSRFDQSQLLRNVFTSVFDALICVCLFSKYYRCKIL